MQTTEEMCALIRAEAEGRVIEFRPMATHPGPWMVKDNEGYWAFCANAYRIKPGPREFVLWRSANELGVNTRWMEIKSGDVVCRGDAIRVREVIGESEK